MQVDKVGFSAGDRVKINPDNADAYVQPWRDRIRRGLFGTVSGQSDWQNRIRVNLDMPSRAKTPHDWVWDVHAPHLLLVSNVTGAGK